MIAHRYRGVPCAQPRPRRVTHSPSVG